LRVYGTHPDFQRQGLGKAVMAEGLRRMQAAGMRRASLVFNSNTLAARARYMSMGFRASRSFVGYRKAL
jgi:ribosomal protein S18 acetylase RimI-like enzyme